MQAGLPDWTFQPSALQELWCHQPDSELAELDWSLLLPHYSPSLVPIVEGLPGMEVLHMLSSQDIIDDITGTLHPGAQLTYFRPGTLAQISYDSFAHHGILTKL